MTNSVARFSNRADNYARYRPSYPAGLVEILRSSCDLTEKATIADVGSGTGILSEVFLENGNSVIGIEPNAAMRQTAERLLKRFAKFVSIDATAEATTLKPGSVDFITAGQAFHWFNREKCRREFARLLKPGGWVVLIWNERLLDSTPFLRDYENLLLRYGTDYQKVRHENVAAEIDKFFAPAGLARKSLPNLQNFDFQGLKGRVLSSSYTPEPGHPDFEPMLAALQEIFSAHEDKGIVTVEYDTKLYYGQLKD